MADNNYVGNCVYYRVSNVVDALKTIFALFPYVYSCVAFLSFYIFVVLLYFVIIFLHIVCHSVHKALTHRAYLQFFDLCVTIIKDEHKL